MSKKIQINKQFFIRADIQPKTFNKEKRTVEVIFSTGATVRRESFFDGPFDEKLMMGEKNIRMDWISSGKAPVLNSHGSFFGGLNDVIGVVESARLEGKKAIAEIRFSDRDDVKPIVKDVEDGILKNISVGYRVHQLEKIEKKDEKIPTFNITDWEPMEVSLVSIPADRGSAVRSLDESYECEILNNENLGENEMTIEKKPAVAEKVETRTAPAVDTPAPVVVDVEKIKKDAADAERVEVTATVRAEEIKRQSEISDICERAGVDKVEAQKMFADGKDLNEVRAAVLDLISKKSDKGETRSVQVEVGADNGRDHRIIGATEALLHRSNSAKFKMTDKAKAFRFYSLMDLAKDCLRGANENPNMMDPSTIASRAFLSTSDFPKILENVLNKSLREGYATLPRTFEPFIRTRSLRDFKTVKSLQKGPAPKLLLKGEGQEIKSGTITEGSEEYALATYARRIDMTRETIINDDLGAFTTLPGDLGMRIADLENDLFWSLITTPQVMDDGFDLFNAAEHGNLGVTAGKPSIDTLNEARQLGREQTDLDGDRKININLPWLVVAPEDETVSQQITVNVVGQSFAPATIATLNPFTSLQVIVEPRLAEATQPFYLFGSAAQTPMAEKGILQGQESGPITSTFVNNDNKGLSTDIMFDVVFRIVDFRSFVKMPGA